MSERPPIQPPADSLPPGDTESHPTDRHPHMDILFSAQPAVIPDQIVHMEEFIEDRATRMAGPGANDLLRNVSKKVVIHNILDEIAFDDYLDRLAGLDSAS